jgi:hypothetical protein
MHRINMIAGAQTPSRPPRREATRSSRQRPKAPGLGHHLPPEAAATTDVCARVKLGELLLKAGMLTPDELQKALNRQRAEGGCLQRALVRQGLVGEEEITSLLSRTYGVPSINLDHFEIDPAIIKIIPAEVARRHKLLPLSQFKRTLTIAVADPTDFSTMDDIRFMTGCWVEPVVASEASLEEQIERYYGSGRRARPTAQPDQVDQRPYPPVAPLDVGQFLLRRLPCVHVLHVADDGEATLYTYSGALHVEETGFARDHGLSPGRYEGEAAEDGRVIWHRLTLA